MATETIGGKELLTQLHDAGLLFDYSDIRKMEEIPSSIKIVQMEIKGKVVMVLGSVSEDHQIMAERVPGYRGAEPSESELQGCGGEGNGILETKDSTITATDSTLEIGIRSSSRMLYMYDHGKPNLEHALEWKKAVEATIDGVEVTVTQDREKPQFPSVEISITATPADS